MHKYLVLSLIFIPCFMHGMKQKDVQMITYTHHATRENRLRNLHASAGYYVGAATCLLGASATVLYTAYHEQHQNKSFPTPWPQAVASSFIAGTLAFATVGLYKYRQYLYPVTTPEEEPAPALESRIETV